MQCGQRKFTIASKCKACAEPATAIKRKHGCMHNALLPSIMSYGYDTYWQESTWCCVSTEIRDGNTVILYSSTVYFPTVCLSHLCCSALCSLLGNITDNRDTSDTCGKHKLRRWKGERCFVTRWLIAEFVRLQKLQMRCHWITFIWNGQDRSAYSHIYCWQPSCIGRSLIPFKSHYHRTQTT